MEIKDLTVGMCKKLGIILVKGDSVIINGYESPKVLCGEVAYIANSRSSYGVAPVNMFAFRPAIAVKPNSNVPVYVKNQNGTVDCVLAGNMPLSLEWKPAIMEIIDAIESGTINITQP